MKNRRKLCILTVVMFLFVLTIVIGNGIVQKREQAGESFSKNDESIANAENSKYEKEENARDETSSTLEESVENVGESEMDSEQNVRILEDDDLVLIAEYIPDIFIDLKYATNDNFTDQVIYNFTQPYLRYGTIKKLMAVSDELKECGFMLKIWDAYRPTEAQFRLWAICPDPVYVANPNRGYSSHSRGNTIDVTLVTIDGMPVAMPTEFDDFSSLADRDYSDIEEISRQNAVFLEKIMEKHGFKGYWKEWWHYSDITEYPVIDEREEKKIQ